MNQSRRIALACLAVFLVALALFLPRLQVPGSPVFDEAYYVPAARQFLTGAIDPDPERSNLQHPPLGKALIAVGMAVLGDHPLGWRFMSAVFGALTLAGLYAWAWVLFASELTALFAVLVTLFNHLLYVQARVAMLDSFMFAFAVWGIAAFSFVWNTQLDQRKTNRYLLLSGTALGLAVACKWTALVPWAVVLALVASAKLLNARRSRPRASRPRTWIDLPGIDGIGLGRLAWALIALPLLVYFLTFTPYLLLNGGTTRLEWADLFKMQAWMWDNLSNTEGAHPYFSAWWNWPLLTRPVWYLYEKDASGAPWSRGIIMLGNPQVMWAGLLAAFYCAWIWIRERTRAEFLVIIFYFPMVLCWALSPREAQFYYYYYPAGMILSLALAAFFHRWSRSQPESAWTGWAYVAGCAAIFAYFLPILSALKIPAGSFRKWMWLSTWI